MAVFALDADYHHGEDDRHGRCNAGRDGECDDNHDDLRCELRISWRTHQTPEKD